MKLILAEVQSNQNFTQDGTFFVTTGDDDGSVRVQYVSPYLGGKTSGFIAIPEVGARVLICQADNDPSWYYLGTTANIGLGGALGNPDTLTKEKGVFVDPELYLARGAPQRYSFTSPKGNALILSDSYNPDYFNVKVELKSGTGKALKLIDSPLISCIILENEHGDRIRISSDKSENSMGSRAIEIESKGNIDVISREGTMNLRVVDGRELNIINSSTGSKRAGSQDPTPGNINIVSENADINLTVKKDSGTIFVEAQGSNGHIVLKSQGTIDISGDKGVNISADNGNVVVKGTQILLN